MTIELGLCIAFMIAAFPVSKSVAAHYAAFGLMNFFMLGITSADSSFLALLFGALLAFDVLLILAGGRRVLLISAIASIALCIESIFNSDWLLSHVTYLSAAVNTVIAAHMVKEYVKWMGGKFGR